MTDSWLALMIGNSRLHWAAIAQGQIHQRGEWSHLTRPASREWFPAAWRDRDLYIVSVVPEQLRWWAAVPRQRVMTLADVPLTGKYETLGCDRALAVWGAGQLYGAPVLVIDGGTALTVTALDRTGTLLGGAILPGLHLQMRSLTQGTAALPEITAPIHPPELWANSTTGAIQSGVWYTLVATVQFFTAQWREQYPEGAIVFTGGDGAWLYAQLHLTRCYFDPDLIVRGLMRLGQNEETML